MTTATIRAGLLLAIAAMSLTPAQAATPDERTLRGTLLSVTDPKGDALGDGTATLPTRPPITEPMLDITRFTALSVSGGGTQPHLQLRTTFAAVGNPWNAPLGFSAQTLDIFIKTQAGGETALSGLQLLTKESGWQYHVRVHGFGATLETSLTESELAESSASFSAPALPAPTVRLEGQTVVVDTTLPAGDYMYWVASSVYSPFAADGLLRPNAGGGDFAINTALGDTTIPVPLDILVPEQEGKKPAAQRSKQMLTLGRLVAVGELPNPRPWWLAGIGAIGLLVALACSAALWQWSD